MATTPTQTRHLTARQREILSVLADFAAKHRYAPSLEELCETVGLASKSTVHTHLGNMRHAGVVDWCDGEPRTLHLTPLGDAIVARNV